MGTIFEKNLGEENKPKNTLCVCKFLLPKKFIYGEIKKK
jgi:hypothetical protein